MGEQGVAIGPSFEENELERSFAIHVNTVRNAARLGAGATDVLQTESADLVERILPRGCAAGYQDPVDLPIRFSRVLMELVMSAAQKPTVKRPVRSLR